MIDKSKRSYSNYVDASAFRTDLDLSFSHKNKMHTMINNNGRITGPVDSHHSTKLESVKTSSTVLNRLGLNSRGMDSRMSPTTYCNMPQSNRENGSKELDLLMRDLHIDGADSISYKNRNHPCSSNASFQNTVETRSNFHESREMQLMTDLLEAQKEISNLRRSMNNLDLVDTPREVSQSSKTNSFMSQSYGLSKGNANSFVSDARSISSRSSPMWNTNPKEQRLLNGQSDGLLQNSHRYLQPTQTVQEFGTLDGRATPSSYSAHRENMREKNANEERVFQHHNQTNSQSRDVVEDVETINLQPIGKGIQDLNIGNSSMNLYRSVTPVGAPRFDHGSNGYLGNIGSQSPRQNIAMSKGDIRSINRKQASLFSPITTCSSEFLNESSQNVTMQSVEEKLRWWYQPHISRDQSISILKHQRPGSFLIRDSNTYSGSFGLAVKVAVIPSNFVPKSDDLDAEKVRHYLIEPMGNQGFCFKGFPEEPVFHSLANLVLYYTHSLSVLPCLLILPDRALHETPNLNVSNENAPLMFSPKIESRIAEKGNGFSVYYLGCYEVEYITGPSVINKAIERLLTDLDARKFTECQMRINPDDGIVLTDMERKLFFRRHHSFGNISFCALDPRDRKIELEVCKSKGVKKTKLFGIIVKNYVAGESKCFLFGELDSTQKASTIVRDINDNIQRLMPQQ